jgi:hypothetical protein
MRRVATAVSVAACGLFVGWIGQGVWRHSPDEIWAASAVVGVLGGLAIGFERPLSTVLGRVTRPRS